MATQLSPPSKVFTLGVLLIPPVQLLDISPTDLFGMLTPSYLRACNLPTPFLNLGVEVEIYYISESHNDPPSSPSTTTTTTPRTSISPSNIVPLTASASLLSTHSLTHQSVSTPSSSTNPSAPQRKLSALLIPGPDPAIIPSSAITTFLKSHAAAGTDILTVCTGIFVAGHASLLDGRHCTGPRALVGTLKKKFPGARWSERRWERDAAAGSTKNASYGDGDAEVLKGKQDREGRGELWSSGGITNGQDMVAAYLRHRRDVFSTELVDLVCRMADVGGRSQNYDIGGAREGGWWLWLILRSLVRGWGKK